MNMATRPYHVVVWGASGFTGRLVAEHLSRDYKGEVKWALAGRSREKLEQLRLELSETYGAELKDVPILTGDLSDQSSLDAIAGSTHVVLSTAGPFLRLGTPVVDAAVRCGCHYVDITGETPWVQQLVKKHHEEAANKRLRIVPCCGYDSTPFDMGALLVASHIRDKLGKQVAKVENIILSANGGFSGGTLASGMTAVEEAKKRPEVGMRDLYDLVPPEGHGSDKESWGIAWSEPLKRWVAPFVMQICNARVVHRSNYLLNYGGPSFEYREGVSASSWLGARAAQVATLAGMLALSQTWLHPLIKRMMPAGTGPSREQMLGGHYKHAVLAYTAEPAGTAPTIVRAEVGDPHRDPGYWGTSRMLLEAALTLALQQDRLEADPHCIKGGVLTPASALGVTYIERLRRAGLTFEVKEEERAAGAAAS